MHEIPECKWQTVNKHEEWSKLLNLKKIQEKKVEGENDPELGT